MCTVVTFGQCNPQQKGVWMDIYIYNIYIYIYISTECRVLHLLPLRYPERHFRRLPALETRCFESDSLTCFGRFGHFRPYKWFAGVVGRLEAILQHWTTGMTLSCHPWHWLLFWTCVVNFEVMACLGRSGHDWPVLASFSVSSHFEMFSRSTMWMWCVYLNFWDFESIDNAKRWNACVMGVFLHPGSKAETAWFERNFIFFDEIDDKQCHRTVRRKNRFAAHVFMSVFRPRWNQFFHPNNLNKQFEASEFDRNRFFLEETSQEVTFCVYDISRKQPCQQRCGRKIATWACQTAHVSLCVACKRKAGTGDFRFAGLFSRRFSRSL